jgi:hypothetical protein
MIWAGVTLRFSFFRQKYCVRITVLSSINQLFYIGRGIGTLPVRDCRNGIAYHYHQFNQFNSVERPLIFKLAVEMYFIILGYYTWFCARFNLLSTSYSASLYLVQGVSDEVSLLVGLQVRGGETRRRTLSPRGLQAQNDGEKRLVSDFPSFFVNGHIKLPLD